MRNLLDLLHKIDLLIDEMATDPAAQRFDVAVAINLLRYGAYEARVLFEKILNNGN
tara:strand:- start:199 stop:366 length:168 start_codon:yes stop_codon:yes gene_type:complete